MFLCDCESNWCWVVHNGFSIRTCKIYNYNYSRSELCQQLHTHLHLSKTNMLGFFFLVLFVFLQCTMLCRNATGSKKMQSHPTWQMCSPSHKLEFSNVAKTSISEASSCIHSKENPSTLELIWNNVGWKVGRFWFFCCLYSKDQLNLLSGPELWYYHMRGCLFWNKEICYLHGKNVIH